MSYMYTQPGKKLLFMGAELGQRTEWAHEGELAWEEVDEHPSHRGISRLVRDLNRLYQQEPVMHELDCDGLGFEWAEANDSLNSVLAYFRKGSGDEVLLVVHNMTPVLRHGYRIGVWLAGKWEELLNTDAEAYWGSGQGNLGGVEAVPTPCGGHELSVQLTLPPLATVVLKHAGIGDEPV
jgi:1,4-alpha-glucan branching enzyme